MKILNDKLQVIKLWLAKPSAIKLGEWIEVNSDFQMYFSKFSDKTIAVLNFVTTELPNEGRGIWFNENNIMYKVYKDPNFDDINAYVDYETNNDVTIEMLNYSEEEFFQQSCIDDFQDLDYNTYKTITEIYFLILSIKKE